MPVSFWYDQNNQPNPISRRTAEGGARSKDFTIAATATSITLGVTLCNTAIADWQIGVIENVLGIPPHWYALVEPVGGSAAIRYVYQVPPWLEYQGARGGRTVSVTIPRAPMVGVGYPSKWDYVVFGLGIRAGELIENNIVQDYQREMVVVLSGSLTIAGAAAEPEVICGVL